MSSLYGTGPTRVDPDWWVALWGASDPNAARAVWTAAAGPILGARSSLDGVEVVEVTFLAWDEDAEAVLLHLCNLTDNQRADLTPSLLERVPGTGLWGATFLLAADAILSYRITDVSGLPRDVGTTRDGWREVHRRGRADPRNPDTIPTPLGGGASVWTGPEAPWRGWPAEETEPWHAGSVEGVNAAVLAGDDRVVVLFDGRFWEGLALGAATRAAGLRHTLVAVDTGDALERARVLTDVHEAARLVHAGLQAASDALGRRVEVADVVAGQSLGGLAVGMLLARRPELLRAGIVQSGSFWWRPGQPDFETPGELVLSLRNGEGDVRRPVVIQVGTLEDELLPQACWYRDALLDRGAPHVSYREVRGGHDYAWWRHGIVEGLRQLGAPTGDSALVSGPR